MTRTRRDDPRSHGLPSLPDELMKLKLTLLVALAAIPGVIAMSWLALPLMLKAEQIPVPLSTLQMASTVQGIVFVLVAAALGSALGAKVNLAAPGLSALLGGGGWKSAMRPQLLPGLLGGLAGAAVILGFRAFVPAPLAAVQHDVSIPLVARVLYGGITEEVLLRWGLMTLLVWLGWRIVQRGASAPSRPIVAFAIVASALIFGAAHLPAVAAMIGTVPASVAVYVIVGNALFGVVAGVLFGRFGLESAILAHVLAHLLAFAVAG